VKSRKYLRVLLWAAPLAVLFGYWAFRTVRDALLRSAVEESVARATGGQCSVGRATVRGNRIFFSKLSVGLPSGRSLCCEAAVVPVDGWPMKEDRPGRIDALKVTLRLAGLPAVTLDKVNLVREAGPGGKGHRLELLAQTDCADLNPLLRERGRVEFLAGTFDLRCRPKTAGDALDCAVSVRLRDFKVRGLDGRFEVEGREAQAGVKLTGTVDEPRLDLGELEPYLGEDFVKSFKDLAP
jgi:hypothetical protein